MVRVNIISGFLGAGKTTLIKKLLAGAMAGEKIVLLENEYGDVGVDGNFLKDTGVAMSELNSGCICCTLAEDFQTTIDDLLEKYHPDRMIIEPTGVGKLSEIVAAVNEAKERHPELDVAGCATVVDAIKCKMHMKAFGEFFLDQVKTASTIIFSRTQMISADKVEASRHLIEEQHADARIVTTPWDDLSAEVLLQVIESGKPIEVDLHDDDDDDDDEHEHHHHHHHEDGEECTCGHHHHHDDDDDDDDDEHEHHHHHHEDGEECTCGHHHHHEDDDDDDEEHEHHHHHEDGEECTCGHHHHHDDDDDDDEHEHHHHHEDDDDDDDDEHEHHHHHHDGHCSCGHHHHHHHHHGEHDADEVFQNVGVETARRYEIDEITAMVDQLGDEDTYGVVLRAKGILQNAAGEWFQFDYVPGELQTRPGVADYTGRLCVIGANIKEAALKKLFKME